jgi:putative nucleotidyltransferase with HDIG domain
MTQDPRKSRDTGRIAKAIDSLPTLPIVALRIGDAIHSKNVSVQHIAEILRTDPAMSAKLLRLVNSPYFGIPGGVNDIARAIPFVGFNTLYQLVLSISVLETLDTDPNGIDHRALWVHSLSVATAARELASDLRFSDEGACFTAGLLHDMGKIALARLEPVKLAAALAAVRDEGITLTEAEHRFELSPHDRVGSVLAKLWRFPATLAVPIEQHHAINRADVRERLAPNLRQLTEIVTAADYVAHSVSDTFGDYAAAAEKDPDTLALLARNGFSDVKLQELCDRTRKQLERSKIFLSVLDAPRTAAKTG